jgi:hypothetical protein
MIIPYGKEKRWKKRQKKMRGKRPMSSGKG